MDDTLIRDLANDFYESVAEDAPHIKKGGVTTRILKETITNSYAAGLKDGIRGVNYIKPRKMSWNEALAVALTTGLVIVFIVVFYKAADLLFKVATGA